MPSLATILSSLEGADRAIRFELVGKLGRIRSRRGGREFFLQHRLYKSHRDGSVANPVLTKLSFPPRWHYDLLRGLDHFATTNAPPDDRYHDALDVLHNRRRKDGTWPVQHKHGGRVWFDMEQAGHPSRWNTLRALRVQHWNHQATTPAR